MFKKFFNFKGQYKDILSSLYQLLYRYENSTSLNYSNRYITIDVNKVAMLSSWS
jgi:hypothetical protein